MNEKEEMLTAMVELRSVLERSLQILKKLQDMLDKKSPEPEMDLAEFLRQPLSPQTEQRLQEEWEQNQREEEREAEEQYNCYLESMGPLWKRPRT